MHLELATIGYWTNWKTEIRINLVQPGTDSSRHKDAINSWPHTGAIKEGVKEISMVDLVEGHSIREWAGGRIPGGRYAFATPPCWGSLYETIDNIIISHIHLVPNSIIIENYN